MPPLSSLFGGLTSARGLVLAVSGGPDSTALMHMMAEWRPDGLPIHVATVDHGLRPEARHDADAVAKAATTLGFEATVLRWKEAKPGTRLQERARAARYDLLLGFMREIGALHLVTAHTLDDQAETVLMRLSAGSGPRGLAGMRPLSRRGDLIIARPFLGVRKAALVSLCRKRDWPYVDDPSNHDPRFARARLRHIAPLLAREGLTPERLGQLAARLSRAEEVLATVATQAGQKCAADGALDAGRFAATLFDRPDELVLRILATSLHELAPQAVPRLQKLEVLLTELRAAHRQGQPLRRTLQGCVVTLASSGGLTIRSEMPRRAGPPRAG